MDVLNGPCAALNGILCNLNGHGRTFGINVLSPNYSIRANKEFWSFMVIYITFNIMTIHTFTAVKDDFIQTAFWCVTLAFQIQVSTSSAGPNIPVLNLLLSQSVVKLHFFLGRRDDVLHLSRHFHEIYLRNRKYPDRKAALDKFLDYSSKMYNGMKLVFYMSGSVLALGPIIISIYTRERVLPLGIFLPYLDYTTFPGYEVNYILIMYLLYLLINGLTSSETYFVLHVFLEMGLLNMLRCLFVELNGLIQEKALRDKKDSALDDQIERKIKEILFEQHENLR